METFPAPVKMTTQLSFLAGWNQSFHGIKGGGSHPAVRCWVATWSCIPEGYIWETESLEPIIKR